MHSIALRHPSPAIRFGRRWCVAVGWAFGLWATALAADSGSLLASWFAAQTNLHTWSAEFIQTRTLRALTRPLTVTGRVWVEMPERFRWELGSPAQTIALRRPGELLVIYPLLKRVERYPLDKGQTGPWRDAMSLLEAGFPRSRAELESQFNVLSLTVTNATMALTLQPRSATVRRFMTQILVSTDTNRFNLLATEVRFVDGSSLRSDFTRATINPSMPSDQFQWHIPADFKVTEPAAAER
jgi:outer membrane lipoprotein-sorting protein